jgi:nucleotide-binding universal stress UspA family protein
MEECSPLEIRESAAMRKSILVATAFDAASGRALEVARGLAKALDAEIVLVHAHDPPPMAYPEMPPDLLARAYEELGAAARKALDNYAAAAGGLRSILRRGDPATVILEVIDETRPILVALGTHGRRGLKRMLIGSVAEQIVRASAAPVLTVHASE